jgi:hypothetical protein
MNPMALPREGRKVSKFNDLKKGLGRERLIELQSVSAATPKPSLAATVEKPDLVVETGDLPATACAVRDQLTSAGCLFDRGLPVKVVPSADGGPPTTTRLTANRIVMETHRLCRPVKLDSDEPIPVTLPDRVARMYLEMSGNGTYRPSPASAQRRCSPPMARCGQRKGMII